jgi:hypothetical protein
VKTLQSFVALAVFAGVAGCSDPGGQSPAVSANPANAAEPVNTSNTGAVGLQLTLPGGADIDTVSWTLAGPDGATTVVQSGTVNVSKSGGASFIVPQIAPATGYTIVLSAASEDGGVSCAGSATFDITARTTTHAAVQLACSAAKSGTQTTLINGTSFDCATWNTLTASPTQAAIGSPLSLAATASGPIPANLTYSWSAPSGRFSDSTASSTTFTCTTSGPVVVTLVVGDGTVPEGSVCNPALDTDTVTITCSGNGPPPPNAPALPAWAVALLCAATMAIGVVASKQRIRPLV